MPETIQALGTHNNEFTIVGMVSPYSEKEFCCNIILKCASKLALKESERKQRYTGLVNEEIFEKVEKSTLNRRRILLQYSEDRK